MAKKQTPRESGEIQIALLPEIAIARVGSAADPVDCYEWVGPDDRPDGTGKTIVPKRPTLVAGPHGVLTSREPKGWNEEETDERGRKTRTTEARDNRRGIPQGSPISALLGHDERSLAADQELSSDDPVVFAVLASDGKSQALRPVAPWFVVCVKKRGGWVPLTPSDLERMGGTNADISWHVFVANRKAYNMTLALEDIVYAEAEVAGEEYIERYGQLDGDLIEKPLIGRSDGKYWDCYPPVDKKQIQAFAPDKSLVPAGEERFRFGRIQVPRMSDDHGIRLRFVPPRGEVYGPTNLQMKIDDLTGKMTEGDTANNFDDWQSLNLISDADFDKLEESIEKIKGSFVTFQPEEVKRMIAEAKQFAILSDDRRTPFCAAIKTLVDEVKRSNIYPDDGYYSDETTMLAENLVRKLSLLIDGRAKKTFCILNQNSFWATKRITGNGENRTFPAGQFANIQLGNDSYSLGLLDDFCDGIVTVTIARPSGSTPITREARIIVGPPDLAPDRRHPMPIQAVLEDRRYLAHIGDAKGDDTHPERLSDEEVRDEVADLFRRVNELIGLTNLDANNRHFAEEPVFPVDPSAVALNQLPLSQKAQEKHRRLASIENLEATFREYVNRKHGRTLNFDDPTDAQGIVNLPPGADGQVPLENYWNRMLVLLRGSQYGPLHLTKRQIAVLERWLGLLGVPWD